MKRTQAETVRASFDGIRGSGPAVDKFNERYGPEQLAEIFRSLRRWYSSLSQEAKLAVALMPSLLCLESEIKVRISNDIEDHLFRDIARRTFDNHQVETFRQFCADLRRVGL